MTDKLSFTPGQLTLEQLQAIHADGVRLPDSTEGITMDRILVQALIRNCLDGLS